MENKTGKYFKYAIGEIVLVVIGILIALQINNWNEVRKERNKEINYLVNIKADLLNEKTNSESLKNLRSNKAESAVFLLNMPLPKTIDEVQASSNKYNELYSWTVFVPNNNTFKELVSSGNLSLIKNDSIKNSLLGLERLYAAISTSEHHMRREYEEYLYDETINNTSIFNFMDFSKPTLDSQPLKVEDMPLSKRSEIIKEAQWLQNNKIINNGLKLAMGNNSYLSSLHDTTNNHIDKLIHLIDEEIE